MCHRFAEDSKVSYNTSSLHTMLSSLFLNMLVLNCHSLENDEHVEKIAAWLPSDVNCRGKFLTSKSDKAVNF